MVVRRCALVLIFASDSRRLLLMSLVLIVLVLIFASLALIKSD